MLFYKMEYEYKYPPKIVVLHCNQKSMQVKLNDTIKKIFLMVVVLFFSIFGIAQSNKPIIIYKATDSADELTLEKLKLKTDFSDSDELNGYINKLPSKLLVLGYPFGSIDTFYKQNNTHTIVEIFLGKISPTSVFINVVFPDPFVPSSPNISFFLIVREISLRIFSSFIE